MKESHLQAKIMDYLKKNCPGCWIFNTNDRTQVGIPDILMLYENKFYAFEVKVPGQDARDMQRYILNRINAAGGAAGVVRSINDVKKILGEGHARNQKNQLL